MATSSGGKKRPRADLLSSLDAAFAPATQPAANKYTTQAAAQAVPKGNKQQAYQHLKRKRKGGKNGKQQDKNGKEGGKGGNNKINRDETKKEATVDPLYEKLGADLLSVGIKNCSLHPQVKSLTNPRTLYKTLNNYLEEVTKSTRAANSAVNSLKTKVLTLDNPVKMTVAVAAEKAIATTSRAQTAKLLSGRRRRELGLHLLSGSMKYNDAEQLNEIWTRYIRQVAGSEINVVESVNKEAQRTRNTRLQAKLKYMDLSGCPIEVVQSQNPCNVGLRGIVVAETQQTIQICCPPSSSDNASDGSICTLVKADSRFKAQLNPTRSLLLEVRCTASHITSRTLCSTTMAGGGVVRLLLLGAAFHALCILSIFDIYFQSPVESSIPSANYTSNPPAKRVIVFTVDGCRVDKLYKVTSAFPDRLNLNPASKMALDDLPNSRTPFLGDVMRRRGSWGVSHNHVPTESRPCHVALTAGMYEDPHAVTKNWKQHPVPFDSVFNQSNNAFIFGNRDVAPMLARHAPQAHEEHYSAREENEMAREDPSLLDVWSFRKIKALFAKGTEKRDSELYAQLNQDKLVIYCHFLGTDLSGPKFGAHSREYLENIAVVDELVEKTEKLVEKYFGYDGRSAYVLNSDHGMDHRGDHGDEDPAKTRTAIVAWGAGVQGPIAVNITGDRMFHIDLPTQSRAEVQMRLGAQQHEEQVAEREWVALTGLKRKDVMQADVAPLISALVGLPYPRNSGGVLPFTYLTKNKYRANAVRANAQQLYQHALRKEEVKRARRGWLFVPYEPLRSRALDLAEQIDKALNDISDDESEDHKTRDEEAHQLVEMLSQEMIDISRNAIVYYQRYDWLFLFGAIVLGYVGLALVLAVAYINLLEFRLRWLLTHTVDVRTAVVVAVMIWWRFLADSPVSYYL
ncbi:hypothetical protein BBJ29_002083 [Phytophthora kernoviae]|uniref:GPI ethanolamine phosphate transferase 1 n=1 Tax=Phytophthora kernoviae TaxID=325452 RepID=A0A3R7N397_9STRA|nr:hypothetical protein BBJ29_002083 [Phytophthora kernoviae]